MRITFTYAKEKVAVSTEKEAKVGEKKKKKNYTTAKKTSTRY